MPAAPFVALAALVAPLSALGAVAAAARRDVRPLAVPFVLGAFVAFVARQANDALGGAFGLDGSDAVSVLVAPAVEECAKALVLLAVAARKADLLRAPASALALGAAVGLGFSLAENVAYAAGDANAWGVLVARSVTSTPLHAAATALVAAGASLVLRAPRWQAASVAASGVLLHAAFNAALAWLPTARLVGELYTRGVVVALLAGGAFVGVLLAAHRAARKTDGEEAASTAS